MAKKLEKKTQQPTPEPEKPLEETSAEHTDAVKTDEQPENAGMFEHPSTPEPDDSNTDAADSNSDADDSNTDAETDAVVMQNQCPKCQHVSSEKAIKLGNVNRTQCSIEIDGVTYTNVEWQRIMCERCKQIHFVKTYS